MGCIDFLSISLNRFSENVVGGKSPMVKPVTVRLFYGIKIVIILRREKKYTCVTQEKSHYSL